MTARSLRDAGEADHPFILRLNLESERFLSAMDAGRLRRLHAASSYCRLALDGGVPVAFLLGFREGADYDSENYRWFAARYPRFLYVDRVVVAEGRQGQGWGRLLYDDVFATATRDGVPQVTCEFDLDPPNAVSERFHARYGFREVGRQRVRYGGGKEVSLQAAAIG